MNMDNGNFNKLKENENKDFMNNFILKTCKRTKTIDPAEGNLLSNEVNKNFVNQNIFSKMINKI
jgi:hypothetical protein